MIGLVPGVPACPPLTAATDASLHRGRRVAGYGYLLTDGRWGMKQRTQPRWMAPQTIQAAELRAVALLFRHAVPDVLLTDSLAVVWYLARWQDGTPDMPQGCTGNPGSMLARAAAIAAAAPQMRVKHVRAHRGDLLNEAADSLASIARSNDPASRKRERAGALAGSFLLSWHQQAGMAS